MFKINQYNIILFYVNIYSLLLFIKSLILLVFSVNKQINDKERIAAAMENPNLRDLVNDCITEPD